MVVSEFGSVIDASAVQFPNALSLMVIREFGSVMDVSSVQE